MRTRALLLISLLFTSRTVYAIERWLPIAGTVGAFQTDVRVLNPSTTRDIEVTARFFPAGNVNNAAAATAPGVKLTIPKRQMRVLDDVATLFDTTQLGAIRFTSPSEFTVSARIYAQTATGTLGQSFTAESQASATSSGTVLQLESTAAFRSNIGAVNVANATTTVTWRLYDRNNAVVASVTSTMPPLAVISPTNAVSFFNAGAFDLSDAWVAFTSTNPILAYGSVVDNLTTDPTSIPAQHDPGAGTSETPFVATRGAFFALNVTDLDASVQWYSTKLGLRVVLQLPPSDGFPAVTVLEAGGLTVELIHQANAVQPGSTPVRGFSKAGIIVDDFDTVIAAIINRGVPIAFGPFPASATQPANAIIQDNAGNLIQILGSPFVR